MSANQQKKKSLDEGIEIWKYCIENDIEPIDAMALDLMNSSFIIHPNKKLDEIYPQKGYNSWRTRLVFKIMSHLGEDKKTLVGACSQLNENSKYRNYIKLKLDSEIRPYLDSIILNGVS